MATVVMTLMIGAVRVLFAMSRDGLLPRQFAHVNQKSGTPVNITRRKRRPDLERSFKVPLNPWLPILAALVCTYLALNLSRETWLRFLVWMALGFAIYFLYGYRHSRVGKGEGEPAVDYSRHGQTED